MTKNAPSHRARLFASVAARIRKTLAPDVTVEHPIDHPHTSPKNAAPKDAGSTLVDALIALAIISVVSVAYASGMAGATNAQRTAQRADISSQAAHGILEKAESVAWPLLSTTPNTVFPLTTNAVVRNEKVTLTTVITWDVGPVGVNQSGTKKITVTAVWKNGSGTNVTNVYATERTSNISEAVPELSPGVPIPAYTS